MTIERPVTQRAGARVLVRAGSKVLLQQCTDPRVPGTRWWTLPGGGIDEGESAAAAVARELLEETGIIVAASSLQGPVATRTVTHGYSDRILRQFEQFFIVDIPVAQKIRPLQLTARESASLVGSQWVEWDELASLEGELWDDPAVLVEAATSDNVPVTLPAIELSTVPVQGELENL